MRRLRIPGAVAVLLTASHALAQACAACDGSGLVPCRTCAPFEAGTIACSVATGCARCQGTLATSCTGCGAGTMELERRKELVRQFLAERRLLSKESGVEERSILQCRGAHFDLLFAPGRIEGCRETDLHLQMHLFAARLEALQVRFAAVLGMPSSATRIQVAIVKDERSAHRLCLSLTGVEAQGLGGSASGSKPACVLQTPSANTDTALHRMLVHHVTPLLLVQALPGIDLDALGYGWLAAGLAHWFEADQAGSCEDFGFQGHPQTPRLFQGGDWRKGVRDLLEQGRLPRLAELLATESSDLDFVQHAQAFALVDLLVAKTPAPVTPSDARPAPVPLLQVLAAAKAGKRGDAALALLGNDIDAKLQDFVKERYPRR